MGRAVPRRALAPLRAVGRAVGWALDALRARVEWVVALAAAYVLGNQIVDPETRVIKASVGLFLLLVLFFAPPAFGLSFFVLMFPFPAYTSYGSTNTMIVFAIATFWLLRLSIGEFKVRGKTGFEGAILAMAITLAVSVYNAPNAAWRRQDLIALGFNYAVFILFYLVHNLLDTEEDLDRISLALTVTTVLVFLTVLFEVFSPTKTIIPGWIGVSYTYGTESALRRGGVVGGHDALADFCVLMFPMFLFRVYRATTLPRRLFFIAAMILNLFCLVSTANRGGIVGIVVSFGYLLWLARAEFRIVRYTLAGIALVILLPVFDTYISTKTSGASLLARTLGTQVEHGLMPETRVTVWTGAWAAFKEHVFLGWGPWFDYKEIPLPHNAFLWSLVTVGVIGTVPFAYLLIKLFRETARRVTGRLEKGSFVEGLMTVLHVQIATFIVLQLRTDYQRSPAYVYLAWLLFGMAAVSMRLIDAERGRRAAAARAEGAEAA